MTFEKGTSNDLLVALPFEPAISLHLIFNHPLRGRAFINDGKAAKAPDRDDDEFEFNPSQREALTKERLIASFSFDGVKVAEYSPTLVFAQGEFEGLGVDQSLRGTFQFFVQSYNYWVLTLFDTNSQTQYMASATRGPEGIELGEIAKSDFVPKEKTGWLQKYGSSTLIVGLLLVVRIILSVSRRYYMPTPDSGGQRPAATAARTSTGPRRR